MLFFIIRQQQRVMPVQSAGRNSMQEIQLVMPVQLMLFLLLLPGIVLIGIDYLLYQSIDKRIMLLAMVLALVLFVCALVKPAIVP
jgi:hypothetical protein